jgi:hypothetical protein
VAMSKALVTWINQKLANYPEAQVKDTSKSWQNGYDPKEISSLC